MMFGLQLLPVLGELNNAFGGKNPTVSAENFKAFSPGQELGPALVGVMNSKHEELNGLLKAYVAMMPRGFQESLRAIVYYALSSEPRVLLNFSWAPAYDFEMTIWEMPEPAPAHTGMTILLKGRYPDEGTRFAAS
ncbi:MAG: hypothetical protein ACREE0_10475 [Phenylobacterium sp.]